MSDIKTNGNSGQPPVNGLSDPGTQLHLKRKMFNKRGGFGVKMFVIFVLLLLFLIPLFMIGNLVDERTKRHDSVTKEIINSSGGYPSFEGVILKIPYSEEIITFSDVYPGKILNRTTKNYIFFLTAENLDIKGELLVKERRRGIYSAPVFSSNLFVEGTFKLDILNEKLKDYDIHWDEAVLLTVIHPLRSIVEISPVNWNEGVGTFVSEEGDLKGFFPALQSPVSINSSINQYPFSFSINLQGGGSMMFLPTAVNEKVFLTSNWNSPSFTGVFLPIDRHWDERGFRAEYKVSTLSHSIPHFWDDSVIVYTDTNEETGDYSYQRRNIFGVELMKVVNSYSKTERTTKYGWLFLMVPFVTFFLYEILLKIRIHPIQYLLAGLADLIFYLLLLSISEHFSFNGAYLISTLGIVLLLGFYAIATVGLKRGWVMMVSLSGSYLFLFVTLQQEDYALLYGSIGLFAVMALIMFITRKIDWYKISSSKES